MLEQVKMGGQEKTTGVQLKRRFRLTWLYQLLLAIQFIPVKRQPDGSYAFNLLSPRSVEQDN
jgi:hypothetical protein